MSVIDDTRKLLQDLIAPELKGIQAQVSALEKSVDARFDAVDARFDAVDSRFDALEKSVDDRLASQTKVISAGQDMLMAEMRSLSATVASSLTVMTHSIQDIDRRLKRLEDQQPPPGPMLVQRP